MLAGLGRGYIAAHTHPPPPRRVDRRPRRQPRALASGLDGTQPCRGSPRGRGACPHRCTGRPQRRRTGELPAADRRTGSWPWIWMGGTLAMPSQNTILKLHTDLHFPLLWRQTKSVCCFFYPITNNCKPMRKVGLTIVCND